MSEQKRENGLLARGQSLIRDIMLAVFGNEALFLIVAFLYATLADNAIAAWYREPVNLLYGYIVIPWGAALCLLCDLAARTLFSPYELPVGILLSFLGTPFFIWLLLTQKRRSRHDAE